MTFDEYQTGGMALYADFAEAVADILDAAIAEQRDLRLQNIQCRAKEPASLNAKLAKAGAKADTPIGDVAKDLAGAVSPMRTALSTMQFEL